jgi:predicted oxidoreductase
MARASHGSRLREDGRVIRDMYLARVKKPQESKEPWDYLDIVKTVKGDALHGPNPCIAPIQHGPFYAIKMVIDDLGTYAGIKTDENARALDADGHPIAGLYAAGNDMASIMGGNYPGAGITLGPALTFGYIARKHVAGAAG